MESNIFLESQMALFFSENRKLGRFIHNPIMYKYNIADRNHPIQEVDIKGENSPSVFSSAESL